MNTPTIVVCLGVLAMSALGHFLPQVTRTRVFFGVTVDPLFRTTDMARRILRDYRIALWCSAIAAGASMWLHHRAGVAFLVYATGACGAQMASNRRASIHATACPTAIDIDLSAPEEKMPGGLPLALLPFVALAGLGLWAIMHLQRMPDGLAVHWGFDGPNRWVLASPRTIIGLLAMHALLCLFLTASAWAVLHGSRRVSLSGPAAAAERQFRRSTVLWILTVEYFTLLPPVFTLLQAPAFAMQIWSVALIVILAAFVTTLMHAGQGGARLPTAGGVSVGDRTANVRWIGGVIYFNPTDPALLVEKRMGIGWTLNFGNPWSWLPVMALGVTVVVGPLVIGPLMVRAGPHSAAGTITPDHHGESLESKPAAAGTEESLRRYILSLERGHPNYEDMSPPLAASVRRQLPTIMATIDQLGEYESLTYEGTDAGGSDVYSAVFARGRLEWHIGPLVDGKVAYRYFRRSS